MAWTVAWVSKDDGRRSLFETTKVHVIRSRERWTANRQF